MSEAGRVLASVFVAGRARTKGHMVPMHIPGRRGSKCKVWLKDRPDTIAWMKVLIREIRRQYGAPPVAHTEPVEVITFFRFERERSVAVKTAGQEWPSHSTLWPTADDIGDEDTLRRAIGDALTQSGIIEDDDLVVGGQNFKRWCLPSEKPGVVIVVRTAPDLLDVLEAERRIFGE